MKLVVRLGQKILNGTLTMALSLSTRVETGFVILMHDNEGVGLCD